MKGHVRERGKGNWYAVLSVRDPQTGKRKVRWRSLPGAKGKREAQQECARILTEMQSAGYVAPDKTTVAQFLERWLAHATHLLAANVHPKIAQERLGHSNVSITLNTYSHVVPGMQRDAVAKVDAAILAALNKRETK